MDVEELSSLIVREDLHRAVVNLTGKSDVRLLDDMQVKSATGGLEGLLSVVLRVKVSFRTQDDPKTRTKTLFVKCMPREKFQLSMAKISNVFVREGMYYGRILPLMKQVAGDNLDVPLPECYFSFNDGSNDVIYLEDLAERGYGTLGQYHITNGLDWEHTRVVAKNLGIFHALTMAAEKLLSPGARSWVEAFPVLNKDPMYYVPNPGDPPVPFKGVADTGNEIVVEVAGSMTGLPKMAAESGKLRRIIQGFWPVVCELVKPNSKGHNVLCHGDCWMNNFMFRYNVDYEGNKTPAGFKFIDFQMARYCHPSMDLLFFMHISLSKDIRDKYYDRIISEYYESLQQSLDILNFGPPQFSLEEFTEDSKDVYKPFAVYFGAVYRPCMMLEDDFIPANAEDMTPERFQELLNTGNVPAIRKRLESDPVYRSKVEIVVREFVELVFPNGSVETSPYLK